MVAHSLAALLYLGMMQGEIAHDPFVRGALWEMLADARYGFSENEEAMFIIRNADGSFSFQRWDSTGVPHQAQWTAPIPEGVIAIAHTHPNAMPRPSRMDSQTAMRSKIPVYVVTRTRITKTSGLEESTVMKGNWKR